MPQRSNEFQRLIGFLEAQLAGEAATVTESAMVQATTGGGAKEVDILIEIPVGQRAVTIGIECRDHKRRQGRPWIEELSGKFSNLPIDRKVAVSSSGFTSGALREAGQRNIETMTLAEALEEDWLERVRRWTVGLVRWRHKLTGAEFRWDGVEPPFTGDPLKNAPVVDGSGQGTGTLGDDVLDLYELHVDSAVNEWAEANRTEWSGKVPQGEGWILSMPFTATNKWVLGPDAARYALREVILKVAIQLELVPASLQYYSYGETQVATGAVQDESSGVNYDVAVIYGEDGKPRALKVHTEEGHTRDSPEA